tara:strand:+ start:258 stop:467 length:210 start_codon:yes stop_codon:yes gene_type:complete
MWDLDDKTWMIGGNVKEKPFVIFGENQSSDDIWIVKEVKDNKIICDQFTSQSVMFVTDKEFNIDDVDFV